MIDFVLWALIYVALVVLVVRFVAIGGRSDPPDD